MDKFLPKVGDQLYLRQYTGNSWVDMCRTPYTVIEVSENVVTVQEAKCHFPTPRYYNTLATKIEDDPNGQIKTLRWHPKRGMWGTKGRDSDYPEYAVFGRHDYQPYLN